MNRCNKILILIHFCILVNLNAEEIHLLSVEQQSKAYSIITELEDNLYNSKISIRFPNGETASYDIQKLKSKLIQNTKPNLLEKGDFINLLYTDVKIQKIVNPKINFFSKINGQRIGTFECKSLKIGKARFGPFEIPSNKILIEYPVIKFY